MNGKDRGPTQIGKPDAAGAALVDQRLALGKARLIAPIARRIRDHDPVAVLGERKESERSFLVQPHPSLSRVKVAVCLYIRHHKPLRIGAPGK
jgi:hypothetical protein